MVLLILVVFWFEAERLGIRSADIDAGLSAPGCSHELGAGDSTCSASAPAILDSVGNGSLGNFYHSYSSADNELPPRYSLSPSVERQGAVESVAFPEESEGNPVPTVRADEGILTAYREPQYIGAFIDPDSENIDTLTANDTVVFIGEFIDPDDEAWLNIESPRQMIGRIVDPSEDGAVLEAVGDDATPEKHE